MFKDAVRYWMIGTIFMGLIGMACHSKKAVSPLLARVGQTTMTLEQFSSMLSNQALKVADARELENIVYRWIDSEVLYQSAEQEGILNLPEIRDELKKIERDLAINYFLNQKIGEQANITDKEISAYYEKSRDDFIRNHADYRYSYLICKDATIARSLLLLARQGDSFEQLVKENYPENVFNSMWDSGYLPLEQVIPELRRAIDRLPPGSFYGPVATESGAIFCQLVGKYEAGSIKDLKLVADQIRQRLREERYREQYQQLLISLKNKNKIELNPELLIQISVPDTSENKN